MTNEFVVPPELSGQKIDRVLSRVVPNLGKRAAKRLLAAGRVFIDERPVKAGQVARAGDRVLLADSRDANSPRALYIGSDADYAFFLSLPGSIAFA